MPAAALSVPLRALPLVAFLMPDCTNMCTLVTLTLPSSAQICVLWPLQPYLPVHKYVYFGH
jgi:hypothetical protein